MCIFATAPLRTVARSGRASARDGRRPSVLERTQGSRMATDQRRDPVAASRATITDVATRAGVSPTTVSHVLSGKRLVAAATRARVEEVIEELGFRPNSTARQLRTRRSRMVAVIVPDITNPYYGVLTRGLADVVGADDYGTYVCNTDGSADREHTFVHDVIDRGVDGIVMASISLAAGSPRPGARFDTPVVSVGEKYDNLAIDLVASNARLGAREATAHLLSRGAQRVAMIQGPRGEGAERARGYGEAIADAGHEPRQELMVHGDWTRSGGRTAMHALMALRPQPDAVFCANDLTAIGAIDAAHELGLRIPEDLALVGFDDVDAATIVTPHLTTVRNPSYDTGREAGQLLVSRMLGEYTGPGRTVVLPCPLIQRAST
ncbi:MAG: LacI family DNA-binding transcriptional regulator [Micromonosporaceae bacterium]|nr:LacI family DNA-binding transcriptional regulator [Micromonosporaceae bacterium]